MSHTHADNDLRIAVIWGGAPAEAECSRRSGAALIEGFRQAGFDAVGLEIAKPADLVDQVRGQQLDLACVALQGRSAQDGRVHGVLDALGIPHLGSGVLGGVLALDRLKARELFRLHNLPVFPHYTLNLSETPDLRQAHGSFGYPARVLPRRAAAGQGEALVHSFEQLTHAIAQAAELDSEVVVERAVQGLHLGVGILNGRVLGALQRPNAAHGAAPSEQAWITPELSPVRYHGVLNLASRAAAVLDCRGAVAVELLLTEGGNEYVCEVNTAPDMSAQALLPRIAAEVGYDLPELCRTLVAAAPRPQLKGAGRPVSAVRSAPLAEQPLKRAV